jgi:hypothetical protein
MTFSGGSEKFCYGPSGDQCLWSATSYQPFHCFIKPLDVSGRSPASSPQPLLMKSIKSSPNPVDKPPLDSSSFFFANKACRPPCLRALALLLLAFIEEDIRGSGRDFAGSCVLPVTAEAGDAKLGDETCSCCLLSDLTDICNGCRVLRLQTRHSWNMHFSAAAAAPPLPWL